MSDHHPHISLRRIKLVPKMFTMSYSILCFILLYIGTNGRLFVYMEAPSWLPRSNKARVKAQTVTLYTHEKWTNTDLRAKCGVRYTERMLKNS